MTKVEKYEQAIDEAIKFIEKAKKAIKAYEKNEYYWGGRDTASAKRASMELSMALIELRKN